MKPQPITVNGVKKYCEARSCKRRARHVHHKTPRSMGGPDTPDNLQYLCVKCHRAIHSRHNHFAEWGRRGGLKTQMLHMNFLLNLKQFQRRPDRVRTYLEQQAFEQHLASIQ
jgi:hypothetical protein